MISNKTQDFELATIYQPINIKGSGHVLASCMILNRDPDLLSGESKATWKELCNESEKWEGNGTFCPDALHFFQHAFRRVIKQKPNEARCPSASIAFVPHYSSQELKSSGFDRDQSTLCTCTKGPSPDLFTCAESYWKSKNNFVWDGNHLQKSWSFWSQSSFVP